jgi:hypothetical protein
MENIKNEYIEMETLVSNNCIDIKNIENFQKIINDHKINIVYYGDRTARNTSGKCFMFVYDSVIYTFTYDLTEGIYKTIEEYIDGNNKGFKNISDYHFARDNGLKDQDAVFYYRDSLFLSVDDYKDALKHGFIGNDIDKSELPIVGLIRKDDLQKSSHYAYAIFSLYNTSSNFGLGDSIDINRNVKTIGIDDIIKLSKKDGLYMSERNVIDEYDNYYYIEIMMKNFINTHSVAKKESAFYYYAKFAQYDNASEFINNKIVGNLTHHAICVRGKYIIKDTNTILKEIKNRNYNEFIKSDKYENLYKLMLNNWFIRGYGGKALKHVYFRHGFANICYKIL